MFNATTEAVIQKLFIHWNLSHFTIIFFVFGKTTAALFYAFCIIIHNHSLSSVSLNMNVDIYFLYEILINLIQSFGDFRASEKKAKREKKRHYIKKVWWDAAVDETRWTSFKFIPFYLLNEKRKRSMEASSCAGVVVVVVVWGILLWWYKKCYRTLHSPSTQHVSALCAVDSSLN